MVEAFAKGTVFGVDDGSAVENVVGTVTDGQPSVLLLVGRAPLENVQVFGAFVVGQRGGTPVDLLARLELGVGVFGVRQVRQDGVEVPVQPANHGLVDDVGRDDVVFGVGKLGADEREESVVVDEDLETWLERTRLSAEAHRKGRLMVQCLPHRRQS